MRQGAKPLNMPVFRDALRDHSLWCGLALVENFPGADNHFEVTDTGDVLLSIIIQPERTPITARLGSFGGGPGLGIWRIPPVGSEVMWICPHGDIEEEDVLVIGTLSGTEVPQDIQDNNDQMVIVDDKKIQIRSNDEDVNIDAENGLVNLQGGDKGVARLEDTTDNGTLVFFPGTGGATLAFIPPGGVVPPATPPTINIPLSGEINSASTKTKTG